MPSSWITAGLLASLSWLPAAPAAAQCVGQGDIHATRLRAGLSILQGYGSNVIASVGPDGTLLVDDEYSELFPGIQGALASLQAPPVKVVVNTHWHCDHTGGNEYFAREGALIIAHANSGRRLRADQVMSLYGRQAASPALAWPKILVTSSLQLRWNGEDVDIISLAPGHTDGDLAIFFRGANVLATGDVYVNKGYLPPYFDDANGGSLDGMIASAERLLKLGDEQTIIVPGHGEPAHLGQLRDYCNQLVAIRTQVQDSIQKGLTEDQLVALHPIEDFAGRGRGIDRWVRIVYREYHH